MKSWHTIILFISVAFLVSLFSCSKNDTGSTTTAVLMAGEVMVKTPGSNFRPLKQQEAIRSGDTIKTGGKSFVTLQIGMEGIVHLKEKSQLYIDSALEGKIRTLFLSDGTILCSIESLKGQESFIVKSPTIITTAVSTVFSVSYTNGTATVALKKGTANVTMLHGNIRKTITKGRAVKIDGTISTRRISSKESLELKKVEIVPLNPDAAHSKESVDKNSSRLMSQIEQIDKELSKQ